MLSPIVGTHLLTLTNTGADLFFHAGTRSDYSLTSGRWFRSSDLQGPWQYAASVPGTREAEHAVLPAAIPRRAGVNRRGRPVADYFAFFFRGCTPRGSAGS